MTDLTAVIDDLPESEREQGLRLQATRWAAVRGSIAVWRRLQTTGDRFVVTTRRPRTTGERLQVAVAAYDAARAGTAGEARELALRAFANGQMLDDPGPESGGFWIVPTVLLLAYADDDGERVCTEVIEWAKHHGSLPAFAHRGSPARLYLPASWRTGRSRGRCGERTRAPGPSPGLSPVRLHCARQRPAGPGQADRSRRGLRSGRVGPGSSRSHPLPADPRPPTCGLAAPRRSAERPVRLRPARAGVGNPHACIQYVAGRRRIPAGIARPPRGGSCPGAMRSSNAAAPSAQKARSVLRCERSASSNRERPGSGCSSKPLPISSDHPRGSNMRSRCSSWARRSAAPADAQKRASHSARRSSSQRACGADAIAARAHEELVTAGARPRRDPTESRSNLTASELRVARMAAEGMTNREIAQALFLTENTIETHLRSVFRKLDIRSRSQLARAL